MLHKAYLMSGVIGILILGFLIYFLSFPSKAAQDSVKEFQLYAKEVNWELMPGVVINAVTYNGKVPGPEIRVKEGDLIRVTLHREKELSGISNRLKEEIESINKKLQGLWAEFRELYFRLGDKH